MLSATTWILPIFGLITVIETQSATAVNATSNKGVVIYYYNMQNLNLDRSRGMKESRGQSMTVSVLHSPPFVDYSHVIQVAQITCVSPYLHQAIPLL